MESYRNSSSQDAKRQKVKLPDNSWRSCSDYKGVLLSKRTLKSAGKTKLSGSFTDIIRCGTAAAAYNACPGINEGFDMSCKFRCFHGIDRISFVINKGHSGIWLGNDWNGNIFPDIADDGNKLIPGPQSS